MKYRATPSCKLASRTAAFIFCMAAFAPDLTHAASATVNFNFGVQTPTAVVVTPSNPATIATTESPVYSTVQTTTELDNSILEFPASETPSSSAQSQPGTVAVTPQIGIGFDAVMSDRLKTYTIPVSYLFSRTLGIQATLPIVTAKTDRVGGGTRTETGVGDFSLTVKHRFGSERAAAAFFTLLTAKFATGSADKGLGTGTYDIALTEKVIKRFGEYRGTLMAGITQPLNKPTILGSEVEYGTTLSYMAAVEHTIGFSDLWFGVRAAGMHAFQTKIDGLRQGNSLTTLDISPEFSYYFKRNASINLGVIVPVITDYALDGGHNGRDVAVKFGISSMF